jgi:hypothetical protein
MRTKRKVMPAAMKVVVTTPLGRRSLEREATVTMRAAVAATTTISDQRCLAWALLRYDHSYSHDYTLTAFG